jgi:hypothetical protein
MCAHIKYALSIHTLSGSASVAVRARQERGRDTVRTRLGREREERGRERREGGRGRGNRIMCENMRNGFR